jgi:hypothetical protein
MNERRGAYYPPNWEDLRQQQFAFDNYTCKGCGTTREQLAEFGLGHLECHHINTGPPDYFHPGGREVVGVNLITFCNRCHAKITCSVNELTNLLAPRKQIEISVSEQQQGINPRESPDRPAIQISVSDNSSTPERQSSAKRININLFS